MIHGLIQAAHDIRSYKSLRVKIFFRSDMLDETRMANFPDASRILSSTIDLGWPIRELQGSLWHSLVIGLYGEEFWRFLSDEYCARSKSEISHFFLAPRRPILENDIKKLNFTISLAHTWDGIANGESRIPGLQAISKTPIGEQIRSFFLALRTVTEDTANRYPDNHTALHLDSINHGVRIASKVRVAEFKEECPWVDRFLQPLYGMSVPCKFDEIKECWDKARVFDYPIKNIDRDSVTLPPRQTKLGAEGARRDLEKLGVLFLMGDGLINIPQSL